MMINPSLLFLDEPTSGLDSTMSQRINNCYDDAQALEQALLHDEIAIKLTLVCSYKENLSESVKSEVGSDHNQVHYSIDDKKLKRWSSTWGQQFYGFGYVPPIVLLYGIDDWCLSMDLVLPTVFFPITYWMAGLNPTPGSFFSGLFFLLYNVLCSKGIGLAIRAMIVDMESTSAFGTVLTLTFLLPNGFYVQHVLVLIRWIKYILINQYSYKLLLLSQYKPGETYMCGNNKTCLVEDFPYCKKCGA
ncbi:hypothetical protein ACJIZ3_011559 [Penstemon smallii]|uniref:ABC-2 type transporter transmembrane domain-containing protein n=1 Tax=Penstemon smallii TaxID=265156 RepID=A0ABD3UJL6_9LAMI